jgi:lipopolysaccharide transport system ATP-binding protein
MTSTFDIRRPVGVEVEFDVLSDGHRLVPDLHFTTEDGVCAFIVKEPSPQNRDIRRKGRYRTTAWVPGNLLSEGTMTVGAAVSSWTPTIVVHVFEPDAVAFLVVDTLDGDSARSDYGGKIPGVVRPLLRWDTVFQEESALARPAR